MFPPFSVQNFLLIWIFQMEELTLCFKKVDVLAQQTKK